MRIVFAGTPEPALPSLRRLIDSPRHDVVAVLTRPDAASGRRGKPSPSPVAELALEHGIPVLRPDAAQRRRVRRRTGRAGTRLLRGGGLRRAAARRSAGGARARLGQPALLAAARVAGRRAGAGGDRRRRRGDRRDDVPDRAQPGLGAGVTAWSPRRSGPTDTAGDLLERLSISGAALLETTLDGIADGTLAAVPQPADGVTVAPKITVEEARVRWDLPAHVVDRRIRAVTPNPGAWTMIGDLRVKVGPGRPSTTTAENRCRPA